jgi:hypothetical protein
MRAIDGINVRLCPPVDEPFFRTHDKAIMTSSKERAAEFRRHAAICLDVAQRISLKEDREQMRQVAERWLELAKRAEAETD